MHEIKINTNKKEELINITGKIEDAVKESGIKEGICYLYVPHATAGITINESYDPNIKLDILDALSYMVKDKGWKHDKIDNNAAAHIKSSIVGVSEFIPIKNNKLALGTWQAIMLCEFDGPRERIILINIKD